jgi:hypothetical protein
LYLSVRLYGRQWSEISKMFRNRPDKHIKNHWNTVRMRQRSQEFGRTLLHIYLVRGL